MAKVRVHELAKELGITSKEALSTLKDLGEFVSSASSTIEPPVVKKLRNAYPGAGKSAAKPGSTPAAPAAGTAMDMAQAATLVPVRPIDWQLADAAAYAYAPTDRPLARGMPVLSADGHPSHLARLCDPADPETPTSADVDARDRARRGGRVLAEAARVHAAERTR